MTLDKRGDCGICVHVWCLLWVEESMTVCHENQFSNVRQHKLWGWQHQVCMGQMWDNANMLKLRGCLCLLSQLWLLTVAAIKFGLTDFKHFLSNCLSSFIQKIAELIVTLLSPFCHLLLFLHYLTQLLFFLLPRPSCHAPGHCDDSQVSAILHFFIFVVLCLSSCFVIHLSEQTNIFLLRLNATSVSSHFFFPNGSFVSTFMETSSPLGDEHGRRMKVKIHERYLLITESQPIM